MRANFSYILGDENTKETAVVDPGFCTDQLIRALEGKQFRVKFVIDTHSHRDHTLGNREIATRFGAKVVAHRSSRIDKDVSVDDGDIISLGEIMIRVIHTPGHTPDSICLLVDKKLLTGDTLFVGECGNTREGSPESLYHSLFGKLLQLADDVEVYPGHDFGPQPYSTIGLEKKTNHTLKERTLEEFVDFLNTYRGR